MTAYYNEFDAYPAAWLERLVDAGHIAQGRVDSRSIVEVSHVDVGDATQAHFFAGIGVWSYALRLAGWPDDRPVWTGSCPCQPFSVAGRGLGVEDERHLWPEWLRLITECRPPVIFGEQVASADGRAWLATVRADLEALGYAVGAADLCAAGVGAPHIRQRLYFGARLAHTDRNGSGEVGQDAGGRRSGSTPFEGAGPRGSGGLRRLGDVDATGRGVERSGGALNGLGPTQRHDADGRGEVCRLGDADDARPQGHGRPVGVDASQGWHTSQRHGAQAGPWSNPDWVYCVDRGGVWRPVEPGTFPLAHGAPARVGRLRAYGNAIVAQVAATFIRAMMSAEEVA